MVSSWTWLRCLGAVASRTDGTVGVTQSCCALGGFGWVDWWCWSAEAGLGCQAGRRKELASWRRRSRLAFWSSLSRATVASLMSCPNCVAAGDRLAGRASAVSGSAAACGTGDRPAGPGRPRPARVPARPPARPPTQSERHKPASGLDGRQEPARPPASTARAHAYPRVAFVAVPGQPVGIALPLAHEGRDERGLGLAVVAKLLSVTATGARASVKSTVATARQRGPCASGAPAGRRRRRQRAGAAAQAAGAGRRAAHLAQCAAGAVAALLVLHSVQHSLDVGIAHLAQVRGQLLPVQAQDASEQR